MVSLLCHSPSHPFHLFAVSLYPSSLQSFITTPLAPVSCFIPLVATISRLAPTPLTTHGVIPSFAESLLSLVSTAHTHANTHTLSLVLSSPHSPRPPSISVSQSVTPSCRGITTDMDRRLAPARPPRFKTAVRRGRRR